MFDVTSRSDPVHVATAEVATSSMRWLCRWLWLRPAASGGVFDRQAGDRRDDREETSHGVAKVIDRHGDGVHTTSTPHTLWWSPGGLNSLTR